MKDLFVPYTQALELIELGFDKPCLVYWFNETPTNPHSQKLVPVGQCIIYYKKPWDNETIVKGVIREYCSAPTFSQAFKWFRENYNMLACIYSNASGFSFEYHDTKGGTHRYDSGYTGLNDSGCWDTYEQAEIACIEKLIQIVKENGK